MSKPPIPPGQDPSFIPPGQGGTPPGQVACFAAGTRIAVPDGIACFVCEGTGIREEASGQRTTCDICGGSGRIEELTELEDYRAHLFGFGVPHAFVKVVPRKPAGRE